MNQHSNYELWWQKKSDSSSDVLANACESILRKCAVLVRQAFLESRRLLHFEGWSSVLHSAHRRFRRNHS
jgi:hypothetical protein